MEIILLVVGFSLIVLMHEFGHFIAAKYVGIKVEQFAMGFGPAIFSWRKGLGFRWGSTEPEYNRRLKAEGEGKSDASRFGETEYRWNWVPLGGYVKMLGQDDSKPGIIVNDPRSYTSKTVGQRMLVISAGVIMNIIFSAIAFPILFMVGFDVPRAVVGGVTPMSPAQFAKTADGTPAPLNVGDEILTINGTPQHDDFRKIALNTALAKEGEPLELEVKRLDGRVEKVFITPEQLGFGPLRLLGIGIAASPVMEGVDLPGKKAQEEFAKLPDTLKKVGPGERITAVNGESVGREDYPKLYEAMQASDGRPVQITVAGADGATREETILPRLLDPAVADGLNFAGLLPRVVLTSVSDKSSLAGKAQAGDVVISVASAGDVLRDPSIDAFRERVLKAGELGVPLDLELLRDGEVIRIEKAEASVRVADGRGLGVGLGHELDRPVVAGALPGSSAAAVPVGSIISSVNGVEVGNWHEVLRELRKVEPGQQATLVVAEPVGGGTEQIAFALKQSDATLLASLRYSADLLLKDWMAARTTSNPLVAAGWGVLETRDSILQVYLTIQRLFEGSVPFSGMMGPVGMFAVGTRIASQGMDHLLWFLAIISANLAVVNFLPVPVVDGGHFLFLLIEKIQGKPISERAMVVAQYIGLGLILTLFVAVTYQDILRLITY